MGEIIKKGRPSVASRILNWILDTAGVHPIPFLGVLFALSIVATVPAVQFSVVLIKYDFIEWWFAIFAIASLVGLFDLFWTGKMLFEELSYAMWQRKAKKTAAK